MKKKKMTHPYKGTPIRILVDFPRETFKATSGVRYLKSWKIKPGQARIMYLVKLSFRNGEEQDFLKLTKFPKLKC